MRNPIRSQYSLGIIALATRPQGTNTYEVSRTLGSTNNRASNHLKSLSRSGHMICVPEDRSSCRLNQYFVSPEHAKAWQIKDSKPNASYRNFSEAALKNHKKGRAPPQPKVQSVTWARTPMPGTQPKKEQPRTQGIALGFDQRYQLSPQEAETLKSTGFYSSGAYRNE